MVELNLIQYVLISGKGESSTNTNTNFFKSPKYTDIQIKKKLSKIL